MDDSSPISRKPWASRRGLLAGLAGLGAASILRRNASAQTATPEALYNTGDGSAASPFQIVLHSKLDPINDSVLANIATTLNTQISRDFGPAWSIYGNVQPLGKKTPVPQYTVWPIEIVAANQGYCGFTDGGHFKQDPCFCGLGPQAYVLYDQNQPDGLTHAVSHECLEMLVNPNLTMYFEAPSVVRTQGKVLYLQEVCDPCWTINYAYPIDSTANSPLVSDFVTPSYFNADRLPVPKTPYSFKGNITAPLGIALGCNQQWVDQSTGQGWQGDQTPGGLIPTMIVPPPPNCSS